MREQRGSDPEVTFLRKRRFSGIVDGVPGEWDLELAVRGTPHPQSGMILNLSDIDRMMDSEIQALATVNGSPTVSDVSQWLDSFERKISLEIKKLTLTSESAASNASFVSVAIDDGDHRFLKTAF